MQIKKEKTLLIDYSKAFDMVNRNKINQIEVFFRNTMFKLPLITMKL